MRQAFVLLAFILVSLSGQAQPGCQLTFYEWTVRPDLREQSMEATARLYLSCPSGPRGLSLALDPTFDISTFNIDGYPANFTRTEKQVAFTLPGVIGSSDYQLELTYTGEPAKSADPPWDGGWHWTRDQKDRTWLSLVAGEAEEGSWLPTLDGLLADSASISVVTNNRMTAVATGAPVSVDVDKKQRIHTHRFFYSNAIAPTAFQFLLGYYERYDTTIIDVLEDTLTFHQYFKDYDLERGRKHFRQLTDCYAAWRHFLGPVTFGNGQLTFVQAPHPGSAKTGLITYGNRFMRGNFGGFVPPKMGWDYELVRHTTEQYVAHRFRYLEGSENRWIPHAWTTYLESLFVEFHYGYEPANEYLAIYRPYIRGYQPLIDSLANNTDLLDGAFQAKGALLLHTLRSAIKDDQKWFAMIKDFFGYNGPSAPLTKDEFLQYLEAYTGMELSPFFEQYLRHRLLPRLELELSSDPTGNPVLAYRYAAEASGYNLPVDLSVGSETIRIQPITQEWQTMTFDSSPDQGSTEGKPKSIRLSDENILVELHWINMND